MHTVDSHPDITRKKIRDCTIPSIGLGTYELQGPAGSRAISDSISLGYRHIDTAQAYNNEKVVGQGIKDAGIEREDIFLTDKIWFDKLKPKALKDSFASSLDKLNTDYVDLLLIHWPSPENVDLMDTISAMYDLKREGTVKWIGVSNFTPKLMREALAKEDIICNQVEYHPFLAQEQLLELAVLHSYYLIAYSPLAQGLVFENDVIEEIGRKYNKNAGQVTLRWLMQQRNVVAIPRSSSHEHRKLNIDVYDFELSESEMKLISGRARNERLVNPDFAPDWK